MSDVFISYDRKDRERLRPLVEVLEKQGWSIWWDRNIPPGKTFAQFIEEKISEAKCVLVVWSVDSVESEWVKLEAAEGWQRGILVPVLIDEVKIPFQFRGIQTARLFVSAPVEVSEELKNLLASIADLIAKPQISMEADFKGIGGAAVKGTSSAGGVKEITGGRLNRLIGVIGITVGVLALVAFLIIYLGGLSRNAANRIASNTNQFNSNANTRPTASPLPEDKTLEAVEPGNQIYSRYDVGNNHLWLYLPVTFQREGIIDRMDGYLESKDSMSDEGFEPTLRTKGEKRPQDGKPLSDPVKITKEKADLNYSLYFPVTDALRQQLSANNQQQLVIKFKWRNGETNTLNFCFTIDEIEDGIMTKEQCPN